MRGDTAINFPTSLSAEEKHLKEMFDKFKTIRKTVAAALRGSASASSGDASKNERNNAKRSIQQAEEVTEEVKRKVMSGAINLKKADEKSTFKRTKVVPKRRASESNKLRLDTSDTGNSSGNELLSPTGLSLSSPPLSGSSPFDQRDQLTPQVNKVAGPTLYVRGFDLVGDSLQKAFEKHGTITRVFVEERKRSAFITFSTTEEAEVALKDMDGYMLNGITLHVSFARRQNQTTRIAGGPGAVDHVVTGSRGGQGMGRGGGHNFGRGFFRGRRFTCDQQPLGLFGNVGHHHSRRSEQFTESGNKQPIELIAQDGNLDGDNAKSAKKSFDSSTRSPSKDDGGNRSSRSPSQDQEPADATTKPKHRSRPYQSTDSALSTGSHQNTPNDGPLGAGPAHRQTAVSTGGHSGKPMARGGRGSRRFGAGALRGGRGRGATVGGAGSGAPLPNLAPWQKRPSQQSRSPSVDRRSSRSRSGGSRRSSRSPSSAEEGETKDDEDDTKPPRPKRRAKSLNEATTAGGKFTQKNANPSQKSPQHGSAKAVKTNASRCSPGSDRSSRSASEGESQLPESDQQQKSKQQNPQKLSVDTDGFGGCQERFQSQNSTNMRRFGGRGVRAGASMMKGDRGRGAAGPSVAARGRRHFGIHDANQSGNPTPYGSTKTGSDQLEQISPDSVGSFRRGLSTDQTPKSHDSRGHPTKGIDEIGSPPGYTKTPSALLAWSQAGMFFCPISISA
ncbi:unnamed protein product [Anisakis simplex]|uniref:Negative elongation factor E n=1 Tax=Anisakis simplex TaxID=6269 RepID=A0A0M3JRQ8_ANISI|nr:unnamed protein product [Anisakis simplex]